MIDIGAHCICAAVFSSVIYYSTRNLWWVVIFILGSVFIDVDHFLDHFLYYRKVSNLKDFFSNGYLRSGKVYVIFHSWELVGLLFLAAKLANSFGLVVFAAGMSAHLFIDNIQRENLMAYFLFYRIKHGFKATVFHPEHNMSEAG